MVKSYSYNRKRDFDNLFSVGLKLLKDNKNLKACRNGIYILKGLAMSNPLYTQKCIDTLCALNDRWMPVFIEMFPKFFYINSGFQKKSVKELKLFNGEKDVPDEEKFLFTHPEMKIFLDDISLSQLVINSLSEIFKYISLNDNFRGPYDLSHKYLCSIDLSYFNSNRKFFFYYSFLNSADFEGADLQYSNFYKADLQYADFSKALLNYSILSHTNFYYSDFWCAKINYSDFSYSNLSSSSLRAARLECSNLAYANLKNTSLKYTNLINANLYRVNLQNSYLLHTHLEYANLSFADFREAEIRYADFSHANVAKANFSNATFNSVYFNGTKNTDLAIYY